MTSLDLLDPLRLHLTSSSTLTDLVKQIHHARAPKGTDAPYLLFRISDAQHTYGFGGADAGQTAELTVELHVVNEGEQSNVDVLVNIAKAVHTLMLSWTGNTQFTVRQRELREEKADAFSLEDRRYESFTLSYHVIVEAV